MFNLGHMSTVRLAHSDVSILTEHEQSNQSDLRFPTHDVALKRTNTHSAEPEQVRDLRSRDVDPITVDQGVQEY